MTTKVLHPRCPFCHAGVRPAEEKTACLGCMTWHHLDCWDEGKGCGACGRHIRFGLRAAGAADDPTCPRCRKASLQEGSYDELELIFCARCWGSWVPLASLGPLLLGADAIEPAPEQTGAQEREAGLVREPLVPCFDCHLPMEKWRWRGLTLDCCPGHGLWLDSGELTRLQGLAKAFPPELYQLLGDLGAT